MRRIFLLNALAAVLLGVHGLVHGWWTGRWSDSSELQTSADRLADVPLAVGEWEGEPLRLDAKRQAQGEIRGYLLRRYVHRRLKTELSLLIVCGRAGPIAVHTPDVCYRGAGFELAGPVESLTTACSNETAEFRAGTFRKRGDESAQLRIFWSWNAKQGWKTPGYPRFAFGGAPTLHKLYVVREISGRNSPIEADPAAEFLRVLLPVLDKTLFKSE